MVEDVTLVCSIEQQDIFQVASISFIPLENEADIYSSPKAPEILQLISNVRKLFASGFYFSYNYALTLPKIKQALHFPENPAFVWNNHLLAQVANIDKKWFTFIIQGFIGYFALHICGKKLDFYLLSRRSSQRAGTRFHSRGIDDNGNVSNFVETEQLLYYDNYCCSFQVIRGSIPVFWEQTGYRTDTKLTRNQDLTAAAFLKHFNHLAQDYSRVIALNLTCKKKTQEQMVTDAFEDQVRASSLEHLRYEWFDFHQECKHSQFANSNPLIRKMHENTKNFGFYLEDTKQKTVHMIQRGVFRVNCIDCLDRTNFIQTKLAADIFELQMKILGIDFPQMVGYPMIEALDQENLQNLFVSNFKNIWADNGDHLSDQYTGTGSTHTNITRTGKRDFSGMLDHGKKSLLRFYMQNFLDNVKQEALDILLGTHTETNTMVNISKELNKIESKFCEYIDTSIMVLTWNLNGVEIPVSYDMSKQIFQNSENKMADIVVVGL